MMIIGLILAVLGLACSVMYSPLVGLLFIVIGGGILAKGYYAPAPTLPQRSYDSQGSTSYDISSKPRR